MVELSSTNYVTYAERFKVAADAFVGGDIISIILRQSIRLKALRGQAAFDNKRSQLININEPIKNPTTFLADIPITVKKQEAYTLTSDMTRHPVEAGAVISDHVILQPIRVDVSFEVSNWEQGTASYALELFEALWRLREPIDLMTYHKKITNMIIISFQGANSVPEWGKLSARASFQQIGLGQIETTVYGPKKVKHSSKTGGPDTTLSAQPEESVGQIQPRKSLLSKGMGAIFK